MNQTNSFHTLVFPADCVETGLPDGVYRAGKYGTRKYEINLLDDAEVSSGIFTTEVRLEGKFKWKQEKLEREIACGTKISIRTTYFSPSYDKTDYDPEVPPNLIDKSVNVDTTEQAGKLLDAMFDENHCFDYPKPVSLLTYLLRFVDTSNSVVLDFFSGSATTAHAVMKLNAEDGGHRKFIMVQLPEETAENSEAHRAGYRNICEIGKERIRRAGAEIRAESNFAAQSVDMGFRVFRLADTNMEDVYYSPSETSQQTLVNFENNIKPDITDLDLLFGCILEWGLPLSMPYHTEQIDGVTVHTYNDGDLVACFDKNIPASVIKTIAERHPLRVVFRDDSFRGSSEKINACEIFRAISPDTRVKVI